MQHGIGKGDELVKRGDYPVRQGRIDFDHLDRAEKERVPSPEVPGLRRVNFRTEPARLVLMIKYIVEELLNLRLDGRIIDENAVWNQTILLLDDVSEAVPDFTPRYASTYKPVASGSIRKCRNQNLN